MTTLLQDVRYGLRALCNSPGFAVVAVLSLALGVGANTAIFSIVNAVLLRSLPFPHPERLVKIVASNRGVGARDIGLSVPEFDDLRFRAGVFDRVAKAALDRIFDSIVDAFVRRAEATLTPLGSNGRAVAGASDAAIP